MVRTKHTITQYKSNGGSNEIYSNDNYQTTKNNLYKGINALQERNQNETTLILTSVRYFPFHKY